MRSFLEHEKSSFHQKYSNHLEEGLILQLKILSIVLNYFLPLNAYQVVGGRLYIMALNITWQ